MLRTNRNGDPWVAVPISTVEPTLSLEKMGVARNSNEHEALLESQDMQIL